MGNTNQEINEINKYGAPRVYREGRIECPRCGWKQSDTNTECAMCDLKFPKIQKNENKKTIEKKFHVKKPTLKPKFDLEELKIATPNHFISHSDKIKLKNNPNKFFKIIVNKNSLNYSNDMLINHFDEIISIANEKFIEIEKNNIRLEFKNYLNNHSNTFFSKSERQNLKNNFNKEYYKYYDSLNFDRLIDEFNNKIALKLISNYDSYITHSEKDKLKQNFDDDFDLKKIVDEHNNEFIKSQMELNKFYFDNIAGKSLDRNQRVAVLTDDDATQIVAGAGTGKTLTIQAKVKYLIEKQGILPEDILCISFSNSARDDLAEKLEKTIGDVPIEVRTFHSLGFNILNINGHDKEVPKYELHNLIDTHFKEYYLNHPKEVIEFFSYYFNIIHNNAENLKLETLKSKLHSLDEYDEYLQEYLKLNNFKRNKEYMTTINELIIANFLFNHNISYEIGKQLIFKNNNHDNHISNFSNYLFLDESEVIPENIKYQLINELDIDFEIDFGYKKCDKYPKFYLPEYDIYIDFNSLNIEDLDNNVFLKQTKQEIMDKQKKIDKLNETYDTKLLTVFNYQDDVESLLDDLENKLIRNDIVFDEINWDNLFDILILKENLPEYTIFLTTIERFINLFKGNAKNINSNGEDISKKMFEKFFKENKQLNSSSVEKRNKFFLNIIEKVYDLYKNYLKENDYIDFNDMINDAVVELRKGAYIHNFKYVIVDEYQDTSHTRYNLLKEVQNVTGAKIVVVGDDWQSIYGFTGCDVNLFSRFKDYFPNSQRVTIDITRRNSQKLINVVGQFIQKNRNQIPKKLKSDKINEKPIKIFKYSSRAEEVLALMRILDDISEENPNSKVLILGRNNNDINEILCKDLISAKDFKDYTKITYENKKNLDIQFRTVHKSKGLEADYVFVLNLNNQINGFPNKIVNDPILNFVNNIQNEKIEYPEERRLFYVALTRTKNNVYLFSRAVRPSIFVTEINNKKSVEELEYVFSNEDIMEINSLLHKKFEVIETDNICPDCKIGRVNLIVNNEKGTSYFKCSNFCGWNGGSYHNNSKGKKARKITHVKYAEVCSRCGGMLVVTLNKYGNYFMGCNKFPVCDNSKNLPKKFTKSQENISIIFDLKENSKINKTRLGVYYIDKYIPDYRFNEYSKEEIQFTKRIWDYKDDEGYSINLFTRDLMKVISHLVNYEINKKEYKIALLAVPPSKVKKFKKSPMHKSINIIEDWYKSGELKSDFKFNNEIINYNSVLKRIKDVPTAHSGEGRASCEEHIDSIECLNDELSNDNIIYFVLDDVTTTGNSMKACNEILLKSGVHDENIFNIALGATVRDKYEEI